MKTIFINTENSKANEPHKFVLSLLLFKTDLFIYLLYLKKDSSAKTIDS